MRQELRKKNKSPLSRLPSTASHKVLYATTENYKASVILLQGACNFPKRAFLVSKQVSLELLETVFQSFFTGLFQRYYKLHICLFTFFFVHLQSYGLAFKR